MIIGLFLFLVPFALLFMAITDGPGLNRNAWLVFSAVLIFGCVVFFYLPFLFWSKRTTRWKLWAFSHVNDVDELKKAARRAALCAGYGTFMDNIQIQSSSERDEWRRMQQRTGAPDIFIDDTGTGPETIIYYAAPRLLINIFFYLIVLAAGVFVEYLAFKPNTSTGVIFIGALMILSPLYLIVRSLIDLFRHRPRVILNDQGIFTIETGFLNWNDIFNERVEIVDHGRRGVKYSLHFQYPGGLANIDITDYAKRSQLESLMRIYKGRFKAGR
jgi:4-amino-4-deoxy-L-arabinose transferase-like glycosyltransferase